MTILSWIGLDSKLKLVINTFGMVWEHRLSFRPHLKVWMVIWTWLIWSQPGPLNLQHKAWNLKSEASWHFWPWQLPIEPATFWWNVLRHFGTSGSVPRSSFVLFERSRCSVRYMGTGHCVLQSSCQGPTAGTHCLPLTELWAPSFWRRENFSRNNWSLQVNSTNTDWLFPVTPHPGS